MVSQFLLVVIIMLFSQQCSSQRIDRKMKTPFKQFEKSFKERSISSVEPYIAEGFTINDLDPLMSRTMLAGIVTSYPLKKIRKIRITDRVNDTVFIKCNLVIDKYMGLFSETVSIKMLDSGDSLYFINMGLDVGISVTVKGGGTEENEDTQILLKDFSNITNGGVVTYYEEGLEVIAREINNKQVEGIKIANEILGERMFFNLGLLLMKDRLANAKIDQPVIPITIPDPEYDYDSDTATGFFLNWAYFHEMVELHLALGKDIKSQDTRWFRDGLAEFVSHKVAKVLNPDTERIIIGKRMSSYEEIEGKANLLSWTGTGDMSSDMDGDEGGVGQYAASMLFFIDLTNDYGIEIISELLSSVSNSRKRDVTSQTLINELSKITGEDIRKRIEMY